MNRILCSTGCLLGRPNGRDFSMLKDLCPQIKADGLELLMYDTWYGSEGAIATTVNSLNLPVPVFHLEKSIGEFISYAQLEGALDRMEKNCALAKEIGAEKLVLHLWNGIVSDRNIELNIDAYKYLEEIADKHSLLLTVENVVCGISSPMAHLCALVERYPHISFTFDTKMADFHKELDLIYDPNYRHVVNNFAHFHINDRLGEYKDWSSLKVLHIGHGSVDFDRFFDFVKTLDYQGDFTTEATSFNAQGQIDVDLLNESLDTIREYVKALKRE